MSGEPFNWAKHIRRKLEILLEQDDPHCDLRGSWGEGDRFECIEMSISYRELQTINDALTLWINEQPS